MRLNAGCPFHPAVHASDLSAARSAGCEPAAGDLGRWFSPRADAPLDDACLQALAATMCSNAEPDDAARLRRGSRLQAGFTYLAQFVAHDLTFDTLPFGAPPPAGPLPNTRTPRFDLDCLYGDGPAADDDLYEPDGVRLRLSPDGRDLARDAQGRGFLKDHRNDSNRIVGQLHVAFARFHNRVVADLRAAGTPDDALFDVARRTVRAHYQWLVLRELLPLIAGADTVDALLPPRDFRPDALPGRADRARGWLQGLRLAPAHGEPFVPIEYAVGAGRFGHSMVRPDYRPNTRGGMWMLFDIGQPEGIDAFDLRGYRPLTDDQAIDWRLFFAPPDAPGLVQLARPIDTTLARPLFHLPVRVAEQASDAGRRLAYRTLRRGETVLGLPTGQQVAAEMAQRGIELPPEQVIGRGIPFTLRDYQAIDRGNVGGSGIDLATLERMVGERTPLWYYVLKEAAHFHRGERLGPLGGRLVAEVWIGLMLRDPDCFVWADPGWLPRAGVCGCLREGEYGMVEFLSYAA